MRENKRKLPEGWRFVKLGDVANFLDHKRIPVNEEERKRRVGPYPYYGATGQVGWIDDYIFDDDLVLLAEDGGPFGSKTDPIAYKISGKTWVNNHAHVLKPKDGVNINWLLYSLMLYDVTPFISGSTRGKLNKATASSLPIILPPTLYNQIAIANELERKMAEVDKMRQAALRQKEAIAAMQGAMSREVFPYKDGGKLPEGWRWEKLKKISTNIQYGISKSSSLDKLGPKLLRITDIQEGKVDWTNVPHCECNNNEEEKYLLEDGDIVFTRTGATTGKSFLLKTPEHALFASYLIRVQCDKQFVTPAYLYTFFQSPDYWHLINQESRGGTLAGFNATMLSEMEIPLPSTTDDQIAIASELERKMAELNKIRQATDRQLEAIEALPGAILREVFDFEEK